MIETIQLSKQFRRTVNEDENGKAQKRKKKKKEDFYAVNSVSITANDGEILGILGPNGAGKTTLLRMMGCLLEATSGEVVIKDGNSDETITDKMELKRRIGYLSGNTKMYGRFSPREILTVLGNVYGINDEELSNRINNISEVLSMEGFIDNRISLLSTGQTQKVNIARCLIHNPSIYIFDEPTLGLDIITSESIIEFMKSEKEKNKTILYSTHYMEEAQYLCDRVVFMYDGKIIDGGSPDELMEKYNCNNLRETFKACINSKEN